MKRTITAALLLLAPAGLTACLDDDVWTLFCSKTDPCPPAAVWGGGGAGGDGATSSSSSAASASSSSGAVCSTAADCPGAETACAHRACSSGVCSVVHEPAGKVTDPIAAGDCAALTCDGTSPDPAPTLDPADIGDDNNPCTEDKCISLGFTSHVNEAPSTPCPTGVCNATGLCVECNGGFDCPLSFNCQNGQTPQAKCLDPTCKDQIQNQGEGPYPDCGGPCPPCP